MSFKPVHKPALSCAHPVLSAMEGSTALDAAYGSVRIRKPNYMAPNDVYLAGPYRRDEYLFIGMLDDPLSLREIFWNPRSGTLSYPETRFATGGVLTTYQQVVQGIASRNDLDIALGQKWRNEARQDLQLALQAGMEVIETDAETYIDRHWPKARLTQTIEGGESSLRRLTIGRWPAARHWILKIYHPPMGKEAAFDNLLARCRCANILRHCAITDFRVLLPLAMGPDWEFRPWIPKSALRLGPKDKNALREWGENFKQASKATGCIDFGLMWANIARSEPGKNICLDPTSPRGRRRFLIYDAM